MSNRPSSEELKKELARVRDGKALRRLAALLIVLLIAIMCTVLVISRFFTFIWIESAAMHPTVQDGMLCMFYNRAEPERGDLFAFQIGNNILLRRVIGLPGEEIDMDENGIVTVNGRRFDVPGVEPGAGRIDIELPYTVPQGCLFVMGDNRSDAIDSRNDAMGCPTMDSVIGKMTAAVWPLDRFRIIRK